MTDGAGNPLGYDNWCSAIRMAARKGETSRDVPLEDLGDFLSAIRAIRAKCIDCSGVSPSEARKCTAIGCALWPYRMGTNPRRTRLGNPAALRENLPLNSDFSERNTAEGELPVA